MIACCCPSHAPLVLLRISNIPEKLNKTKTAGGANIIRQKEALKLYKPFLVVGTPGRIAELSRDGALQVGGWVGGWVGNFAWAGPRHLCESFRTCEGQGGAHKQ